MKSVFILMVMPWAISIGWAQSGRATTQIEAEYYITAYAQHYRVPIALARAIAERESNWQPCFLLELGRRRQHIEIEFPSDPCDSAARFELRVGPSSSIYSINGSQLVRLVAEAGEELVGLCYFGDHRSRENIEAQLAFTRATTDAKTAPCDSSSPSKTKH